MPLIILTGVPCVGKSTFGKKLKEILESESTVVELINEESLSLSKSTGYQNATDEKNIRAALKSAVGRSVGTESIVIIDSLNYIKGFRYELYCLARERRTKSCLVWVTLDDKTAESRHDESNQR